MIVAIKCNMDLVFIPYFLILNLLDMDSLGYFRNSEL
jgi:hypothetical protein